MARDKAEEGPRRTTHQPSNEEVLRRQQKEWKRQAPRTNPLAAITGAVQSHGPVRKDTTSAPKRDRDNKWPKLRSS